MARRNGIFRQISQNLYDEGLRQEVADRMAQQAMRMDAEMKKKMKKMTGHAGGQGGMTTSVDIFMMCKPDMKIKCDGSNKFRTYDAHCNNLEGSGFEGTAGMAFIRDVPVGEYDPKEITVHEELIPAVDQGKFKCRDKCKYLIHSSESILNPLKAFLSQMVALQEQTFLVPGWSVKLLSQKKIFQVRDQRIFMSSLGNFRAMTWLSHLKKK